MLLTEFCFCKNFGYIFFSIWQLYKWALPECDVRKICFRNVKYITTYRKDWWPRWGDTSIMWYWREFISKEDQKSQIFLQLTVLSCNSARNWYLLNWYVSNIFNIKSFLFSLEKALGEQSNVIFCVEILVMQENKIWCFLIDEYVLGALE